MDFADKPVTGPHEKCNNPNCSKPYGCKGPYANKGGTDICYGGGSKDPKPPTKEDTNNK